MPSWRSSSSSSSSSSKTCGTHSATSGGGSRVRPCSTASGRCLWCTQSVQVMTASSNSSSNSNLLEQKGPAATGAWWLQGLLAHMTLCYQ
jgi:hypothetical protein